MQELKPLPRISFEDGLKPLPNLYGPASGETRIPAGGNYFDTVDIPTTLLDEQTKSKGPFLPSGPKKAIVPSDTRTLSEAEQVTGLLKKIPTRYQEFKDWADAKTKGHVMGALAPVTSPLVGGVGAVAGAVEAVMAPVEQAIRVGAGAVPRAFEGKPPEFDKLLHFTQDRPTVLNEASGLDTMADLGANFLPATKAAKLLLSPTTLSRLNSLAKMMGLTKSPRYAEVLEMTPETAAKWFLENKDAEAAAIKSVMEKAGAWGELTTSKMEVAKPFALLSEKAGVGRGGKLIDIPIGEQQAAKGFVAGKADQGGVTEILGPGASSSEKAKIAVNPGALEQAAFPPYREKILSGSWAEDLGAVPPNQGVLRTDEPNAWRSVTDLQKALRTAKKEDKPAMVAQIKTIMRQNPQEVVGPAGRQTRGSTKISPPLMKESQTGAILLDEPTAKANLTQFLRLQSSKEKLTPQQEGALGETIESLRNSIVQKMQETNPQLQKVKEEFGSSLPKLERNQPSMPKDLDLGESGMMENFRDLGNYVSEGGGKPAVDVIREAAQSRDAWAHNYMSEWSRIAKRYGLTAGSKDALDVRRILRGEPARDASEVARAAATELRGQAGGSGIFENIIKDLREDKQVTDVIGNVGYLKDYFPGMRKQLEGLKVMGKDGKLGQISEEGLDHMMRALYPAEFKTGFVKKRPKEIEDLLEEDIFTVIPAYIEGMAKTKFDIPAYNSIMSTRTNWKSGIGQNLRTYADNFIGQPTTGNSASWENFEGAATKWFYDSALRGNPFSAMANRLQNINTMIEVGPSALAKGMLQAKTRQGMQDFLATGILREYPSLDRMAQAGEVAGRTGKSLLDEYGYKWFRNAEFSNRLNAFLAGRAKGLSDGLSMREATQYGIDVVKKTQFGYNPEDMIRFTSSQKLLGQFSNYPLKQLEFIRGALSSSDWKVKTRAYGVLTGVFGGAGLAGGAGAEEGKELSGVLGGIGDVTSLGGDVVPVPSLVGPVISQWLEAQRMRYQSQTGNPPTAERVMDFILKNNPYTGGPYRAVRKFERMTK